MALDTVSTPPLSSDFTPLVEHQEQTPGTFFGGKPVLHLHSLDAKVKISREDLDIQPFIAALRNGDSSGPDGLVEMEGIDVWVTSRFVAIPNLRHPTCD